MTGSYLFNLPVSRLCYQQQDKQHSSEEEVDQFEYPELVRNGKKDIDGQSD